MSFFYYLLFLGAFLPRSVSILNVFSFDLTDFFPGRLVTKTFWLLALLGLFVAQFSQIKDLKVRILSFFDKYKDLIFPLLLILISGLIGIFVGIDAKTSFMGVVFYALLLLMLFFIIAAPDNINIKRIFKNSLLASVILNWLFAVYQVIAFKLWAYDAFVFRFFKTSGFTPLAFFKLHLKNILILRPSGFMPDPNFLAAYFIFSLWTFEGLIKDKRLKNVLRLILVSGVLLTASKTGLAVLLISFILYLILRSFFLRKSMLNTSFVFLPTFKKSIKFEVSERGHLFQEAWSAWKNYPWFGIGIGNFRKFYFERNGTWTSAHPHNEYLRFLAELGLVGFVGFLLFNIALLRRLFLEKRIYSIIIVISLLLLSLTYDYYMSPWIFSFLGFVLIEK